MATWSLDDLEDYISHKVEQDHLTHKEIDSVKGYKLGCVEFGDLVFEVLADSVKRRGYTKLQTLLGKS